jgi:hypothetical protein
LVVVEAMDVVLEVTHHKCFAFSFNFLGTVFGHVLQRAPVLVLLHQSTYGLQDISCTLANPAVRGCYEARLPLSLSALLQLGCSARVAERGLLEPPRSGWPVSALSFNSAATPSYLAGDGPCGLGLLRYVGIFAAAPAAAMFGRSAERAVYILFVPATRDVSIIVLLRDGTAERELFTMHAEELWEQVRKELEAEDIPLLHGLQDFRVAVWPITALLWCQ